MSGRGRWVGALALLLVAVLVGGVVLLRDRTPQPTGTPTTLPPLTEPAPDPDEPAADPRFAAFYDQTLAWSGCGDGVECATVTVPVDWDRPEGATLQVALGRLPASDPDARIGSLLYNPGGPGASAVDYVTRIAAAVTSDDLRERYDLVGFDPRGVGRSQPLDCLTDAELDAYLAFDADPETAAGLAEMTQVAAQFAAGCAESGGQLLGNVDTLSAARDMDVIRAALGQERLSYLGVSYGTLLGAEYAELFPQRVGRFALDAALDPSSSWEQFIAGQARGMEQAFRSYVAWCVDQRGCPLGRDADQAVGEVQDLLAAVEETPLRTGTDRPLTAPLAVTGVIAALYDERSWPALNEALEAALDTDGGPLLRSADSYAQRSPDGRYAGNLLEALPAVSCLDYPMDSSVEAMRAVEARLGEVSPTFAGALAYGEVTCGQWLAPPTREPREVSAAGAPPILVVGNTGDPATPYEWAVALADQLESGRLLTLQGEGHASYTRGSRCIDGAVDGYLLDGVLPGEGATCAS